MTKLLTALAMLFTSAPLARAQSQSIYDRPQIQVQISTDDPAYNPPLPGLTACVPNCRWYALAQVITSDLTAAAFLVTFQYRTLRDREIHTASGLVSLHDTNGVRAGMVFVYTGMQPIEIVGVTSWYRITQIGGDDDGK